MHITWFPDTEVDATFQSRHDTDTQNNHVSLRPGCTPSFRWINLGGKCATCDSEERLMLALHKDYFSCKERGYGWELTLTSDFFKAMQGFLQSLARAPNIEECLCTTENPIRLGRADLTEVHARLTGHRVSCLPGPSNPRDWICIRLWLTVRSTLRFRPPVLDTLAIEVVAMSQSVAYPGRFAPGVAYYAVS